MQLPENIINKPFNMSLNSLGPVCIKGETGGHYIATWPTGYVANIEKVTKTNIHWFTYMFGKHVKGTLSIKAIETAIAIIKTPSPSII